MNTIVEKITEQLQNAFAECGYDRKYAKVSLSNRPDLCEYQCNGAMAAAKEYKKAPFMIADEVVAKLDKNPLFDRIESVKPGFINIILSGQAVADYVNEMTQAKQFGYENPEKPKTVIVDYGGANAAKPLHVGHLRSAVIGESVKRIQRFAGNKVIGDVHLGDWGLQMGLIIEELRDRKPELPYFDEQFTGEYPAEAPFTISELEEIYPAASAKSKEDAAFMERAHNATLKLQSGDKACTAIWKHIMAVSTAAESELDLALDLLAQSEVGTIYLVDSYGSLYPEQIRRLADKYLKVAEKYGDGHVHLTSRQSVEIPFIKLDDVEEVKEVLATGGCKPGVCGPRVRTITACQGSAVCPSGNIDSYDIAKKLDERYFARELPHKFKFGVTGCQNNCLKAEENDVGIKGASIVEWEEAACINCGICEKTCRVDAISTVDGKIVLDEEKCNNCGRCVKACPTDAWKATPAFEVSFGGLFGNRVYKGEKYLPLVTSEEQLFRITDAAIQFFDDNANPGERFRMTLERVGLDKFEEKIKEAYNG